MNKRNGSKLRSLSHRFRLGGLGLLMSISSSAFTAHADDAKLILWHGTNIQFLQGHNFKLGDDQRGIVSLNHAHGWTYGDNTLFYDKTLNGQGYFEWHPRLSLSKISGKSFRMGPIKDVLLAGTFELPENGRGRYLGGVGFDWDVPSFKFMKTNFYIRDDPSLVGTTWGATIAWKNQFKIGPQPILFDGFLDLAGSEGDRKAYQLFVPALLADIGTHLGYDDRLYLGVEYQYWHNKFGLPGVTESAPQIELRLVIR